MPAQDNLNNAAGLPRGWGEVLKEQVETAPLEETIIAPKASALVGLKKILPIFLLIIIVGGIVWGVIKFVKPRLKLGPSGKEVTLTYWGLWEPESVMSQVISDWEVEHPNIKINYVRQSQQEYRERLQSALASGGGPDIFRYHLTWLSMLRNELEPLPASVMSAADYEAAFYPVVSENLRYQGQYYGIPLGVDTLVLFYNKSILKTVGESPPTTWDDLRVLAQKITDGYRDDQGRIQVAGAAMGITSNVDHWSDILGLMMLQNGADLSNPTGRLAEDTLSFYTIFKKVDKVWDETLPPSTLAFAGEKLAMYFGFSWDVFEIKKNNPNLDFGIVTVPQLVPDKKVNWASFWVEGVSKKSNYKNEAWQFLSFLSSKETLEKFYLAASGNRLFGEIYPRKDMGESLRKNPLLAPFIDSLPTAKTWYLCSRTFDNGINDRMVKYFEDAVNGVVLGGKSSQTALKTAAQGVAQLVSQYGVTK
jgi:multiple sugar transport system substrate-binding protein